MSKEHREWTARLSDYLADDLPPSDRAEVEAHLSTCDACAGSLEELARVVTQAGALEDLEPPRDLWSGIAASIAEHPGEAKDHVGAGVIAFPGRARVWSVAPARIELSRARLAAAAVVLVAVSASLSWWAGSARAIASGPATEPSGGVVTGVATTSSPPAGLAEELATLEDVLESTRAVLDPNTVRVIERSLSVIEQAIADSREALVQDPGNAFLAEHLERMYRRKLLYLQDAVRLVEWES
jgi:anti-sigma factor RsiW